FLDVEPRGEVRREVSTRHVRQQAPEVDEPLDARVVHRAAYDLGPEQVPAGEVASAHRVHEVADGVDAHQRLRHVAGGGDVALRPGDVGTPGEPIGIGRGRGGGDHLVAGFDEG